eukprot:6516028-Pyramimonas_sp.AAC.1
MQRMKDKEADNLNLQSAVADLWTRCGGRAPLYTLSGEQRPPTAEPWPEVAWRTLCSTHAETLTNPEDVPGVIRAPVAPNK